MTAVEATQCGARRVESLTDTVGATLAPDGQRAGPQRPVRRGDLISRYVVLDRLGAGAMGVVYAAFDPELDRRVAIKLLQAQPGGSSKSDESGASSRLLREAKALARLSHPNVVAVHDVGVHEDRVFVAMEHIEGETLREALRSPRTPGEMLALFVQAGRGLAAAHAVGLVHHDFKPDNVMIGGDGRVRVMDFGIARAVAPAAADADLVRTFDELGLNQSDDDVATLTRAAGGTPAYMAPEQHLAGQTDARTDQFAYCVALYEALFGQRPFRGKTVGELAYSVTTDPPREPTRGSVPIAVRRAVLRGLSKRPADRWPDMDQLLAVLERGPSRRPLIFGGLGLAAVLAGWPGRRWGNRS